MKFERFQKRQEVEDLDEDERIKNLQNQLGIIYDHLFLTGDWHGEHTQAPELRRNIFEDRATTDRVELATGIDQFLRHAQPTVAGSVAPEAMRTLHGAAEDNRNVFFDLIAHVREILMQAQKDINTREEVEMMKCIDKNMHFFRDPPLSERQRQKNIPLEEQGKYRQGLDVILSELEAIVVKHSDWQDWPADKGPLPPEFR
jgi:hypothetical protein